jgi:alkylation response protein AidB-like acyl-CoA dehydrogenase
VTIELSLTEEQSELSSVVRSLLDDLSPESRVRELMETAEGFDGTVWTRMSDELGICGLAVPEEYGGAGGGFAELAVVLEELGRSLACVPYFSSVVLGQTLLLSVDDEEARARWLPALCSGALRATVAIAEPGRPWTVDGVQLPVTETGTGWMLSGVKTFVVDGATADVIFVVARSAAGLSIFAVGGDAPGLSRTSLPTMDQTRKQAMLEFIETPATPVGPIGRAEPAFERLLAIASVALAIEAVGGAQCALDMAVAYARTRVQFGRPIGSFQAIKHKCANMLLQVESAKSAGYYARGVLDAALRSGTGMFQPDDEFWLTASLAKAFCTDAFMHCAAENIQIHGGIGFTWEHPAHLYFKRAKANQLMFGDPFFHRAAIADLLGI